MKLFSFLKKILMIKVVGFAILLLLSNSLVFAKETTEKLKSMALAGDTTAMVVLGGRFHHADGEKQSYTEAARWYRMAAVKRDFDGAYGIGTVYLDQKDYVTAYSRFALYASEEVGLREARDDVYSLLSAKKKTEAVEAAAKLKNDITKEQAEMLRRHIEKAKYE